MTKLSEYEHTAKAVEYLYVHHNTLSEHAVIAEVLTEMDGELAVLEQRRELTRALKHEILTGRTRLV